jgi:hypothetical protein
MSSQIARKMGKFVKKVQIFSAVTVNCRSMVRRPYQNVAHDLIGGEICPI